MVIFDTTNKYYGDNTNILYLSLFDIDYLVNKYGIDVLKDELPEAYAEGFEILLNYVKGEEELSIDYYTIEHLVITDANDRLLAILANEISKGNMFTKKQLSEMNQNSIESEMSELENLSKETKLNSEELYKLRTYKMMKYVEDRKNKAKESNELVFSGTDKSMEIRKKKAEIDYENYLETLHLVGLVDSIKESDYFYENIPLNR